MPGKHMYRYRFATPAMDMGVNPLSVRRGVHSRVYGVDARYMGGLRPFPGMARVTQLQHAAADLENVNFFRYVLVKKGTGAYRHRGFVVRHGSNTSSQTVTFFYYDDEDSAWDSYDLATGIASTVAIDVAANKRFLYIAIDGEADFPKVAYYSGSSYTSFSMGPGTSLVPSAPTEDSTADTGGYLDDGTYMIAYRYYDSVRDVYSGMSSPLTVDVSEGTGTALISLTAGSSVPSPYDKVKIYRTIRIEAAGDVYSGGILYEESDITTATWEGGTNSVGTKVDSELATEDRFDPWADIAENPPNSGAIGHFGGLTFMASDDSDGVQWSNILNYEPESFDAKRRLYRGRLADGPVLRFVEAGDMIYALGRSVLYQIQRQGTAMQIQRIFYARGLVSAPGVTVVGEDMLYISPIGIGVVQGRAGVFRVYSGMDRLVLGDWSDKLDDVFAATDAKLGASFFVEPTSGVAVCLWHVSQLATLFKDFYFAAATEGPGVEDGIEIRAYFVTETGLVLVPDATPSMPDEGGSSTRTMLDVSGTVNGTATGGSLTTLECSTASFDTTCVGARLWYLNSRDEWTSTEITSRPDATTLGFASQAEALASGRRFAISPVPFEVRMSPVPTVKLDAGAPDPVFDRRVVTDIGVKAVLPAINGFGSNDNAYWRVGVYKDLSDTPVSTVDDVEIGDSDAHTHYGRVNADGALLEPFIQLYAAGVDFELTGAQIGTTITVSSVPGSE